MCTRVFFKTVERVIKKEKKRAKRHKRTEERYKFAYFFFSKIKKIIKLVYKLLDYKIDDRGSIIHNFYKTKDF